MPDNLSQNVGSSAISPATCPSPINGEAADAPSIDVPLQNLLDRANYNLTVSSDRVNAFSTAMGITPDNSDPGQLTEAAGKMRDTIATVDATNNKLDMTRRVSINGAAVNAGNGNLLELIAKVGDDARPLLAIGSGEHSAIYASGGSANDVGPGFSRGSGLHAASELSNTALYAESKGTGFAIECHGGFAGNGGLRATGRGAGGSAAEFENVSGGGSGSCVKLIVPNGLACDAIVSQGRIRFTKNAESSSINNPPANTLQASNACKVWAEIKDGALSSGHGVSSVAVAGNSDERLRIYFSESFVSFRYAPMVFSMSTLYRSIRYFARNNDYIELSAEDANGATVALSGEDFSLIVFGYQ